MDSVSITRTAASIEALSRIVQESSAKTTEMSEKFLRYNIQLAVGREMGKGELLDLVA
ncbi:MAG: hypothetical protein ACLFVQ_00770 [Chitinispirillaceae bacterium]